LKSKELRDIVEDKWLHSDKSNCGFFYCKIINAKTSTAKSPEFHLNPFLSTFGSPDIITNGISDLLVLLLLYTGGMLFYMF
jgi:hypothetical protein